MSYKLRKCFTIMFFGLSLIGLMLSIVLFNYWWNITGWMVSSAIWTYNLSELQ